MDHRSVKNQPPFSCNSCQTLRQPLAVSQAWQEHQQVEAASFQKPRKTLLPGSLAVWGLSHAMALTQNSWMILEDTNALVMENALTNFSYGALLLSHTLHQIANSWACCRGGLILEFFTDAQGNHAERAWSQTWTSETGWDTGHHGT